MFTSSVDTCIHIYFRETGGYICGCGRPSNLVSKYVSKCFTEFSQSQHNVIKAVILCYIIVGFVRWSISFNIWIVVDDICNLTWTKLKSTDRVRLKWGKLFNDLNDCDVYQIWSVEQCISLRIKTLYMIFHTCTELWLGNLPYNKYMITMWYILCWGKWKYMLKCAEISKKWLLTCFVHNFVWALSTS